MTNQQEIKAGDTVRVREYDGTLSEPVLVRSIWGQNGEATVEPAAHGCRYWNTDVMVLSGEQA